MKLGKNAKRIGGISTPKFVAPVAIILVILHAFIIFAILQITRASGGLSSFMAQYGEYISEAGNVQAGSSRLSETSFSFLFHPMIETPGGDVPNTGPLIAYCTELASDNRGTTVVAHFRSYDINEDAVSYMETAAGAGAQMIEIQTHAIELVLACYTFPSLPQLDTIPRYTLSDEEKAMTKEEKLAVVYNLITGTEYSEAKRVLSENVSACTASIREEMTEKSQQKTKVVTLSRRFLWGMTLSVIGVLLFTFAFVIFQVVTPLRGFVRGIEAGDFIDEKTGLQEVRMLANAYNVLLANKDKMEDFLRAAAETDALTDLPNRYYFEQYMSKSNEAGYSVALLLFDVNYLKDTNDREGHHAGDMLLKRAASTILNSYGALPDSKCFRYGGDEFAAIIMNCTPQNIAEATVTFTDGQRENNVSIAMGCAYTEDIGNTTFHTLFLRADHEMYAQKSKIHERDRLAAEKSTLED